MRENPNDSDFNFVIFISLLDCYSHIWSFAIKQVLSKAEFLDILKEKSGIEKKDIESVLAALTATVHDEVLTKGNEIRLRELGTFKQKVTAARAGRNPRTGETIQISGAKAVSFSVSSAMKKKDGEEKKE